MKFTELAQKKVAGVPVIYLAGAAVVILAIVAWKMKPAAEPPVATDEIASDGTSSPSNVQDPSYDGLESNGTVIVAPQQPTPTTATEMTNEQWGRLATTWIIDQKLATPGEAQTAIFKYLNGEDLSYAEGQLRDAAVRELKLPPEPLQVLGQTGTAPAKRQGTPPLTHTVKGNNDNMFGKIATLYYGRGGQAETDLLQFNNTNLGVDGPFPAGTQVKVPKLTPPKYYLTDKTHRTAAAIAAKNGITVQQLDVLTNGIKFPVGVGVRVRVG